MLDRRRYLRTGIGTLGDCTRCCSHPIHILRENFSNKEVLALCEMIRDHLPKGHGKNRIVIIQF